MISPFACFDCLFISQGVQNALGNFAPTELHLFAYLGCLLSLYKHRPVAEWGYSFYGTKMGAPFSPEIDQALPELKLAGLFADHGDYLQITERGSEEYYLLRGLSQNSDRETYLEGACSSILALPIGLIHEALSREPEIEHATKINSTRLLLTDGPGLQVLYEHFTALSTAITVDISDLMLPSVVWLTYLSRVSQLG